MNRELNDKTGTWFIWSVPKSSLQLCVICVSCSISCSCFTWKCHHSSAFARRKDTVVLMWLLPPWPSLLLLYSCLPHYSLSWSLQGEKDQQLKSTDTLSSAMHPHQGTHSLPVGGWFIHCTVCPYQLCLSPITLCLRGTAEVQTSRTKQNALNLIFSNKGF